MLGWLYMVQDGPWRIITHSWVWSLLCLSVIVLQTQWLKQQRVIISHGSVGWWDSAGWFSFGAFPVDAVREQLTRVTGLTSKMALPWLGWVLAVSWGCGLGCVHVAFMKLSVSNSVAVSGESYFLPGSFGHQEWVLQESQREAERCLMILPQKLQFHLILLVGIG